MFIRPQERLKSWALPKKVPIKEFGIKLSSTQIHRLLQNRKKKDKEGYREYLYSFVEMGKPIDLDEQSLIQHFLDDVPDCEKNKTILHEAKDLNDLKEKLKIYEKTRSTTNKASTLKSVLEKESVDNDRAMYFPKK